MEVLIGIVIGTLVFWIVYSNFDSIQKKFSFSLSKSVDEIVSKLDGMFIEIPPQKVLFILVFSTAFGFVVFAGLLAIQGHWFLGLLLGGIWIYLAMKLPHWIIALMIQQRMMKFTSQMMDGLTLISNGLKSGLSLMQAIGVVVDEMPNPFSQEFNLILSQQRVGVPMDEAFVKLAERVPSEDVQMFVTAIVILRETGGNLSETFDTIVHTIRERIKVEKKISSMVMMGIMQGAIITAIPFVLLLMLYFVDPEHVTILFTNPWGYFILGMMLLMQLAGGLIIKKIVTIRV
ncbi:MAG: type II secretion system F family protein [Deltaproteobacteria bacterium]|nr:type II secretion system F family protein [Deltaproteobacteria bacterium]